MVSEDLRKDSLYIFKSWGLDTSSNFTSACDHYQGWVLNPPAQLEPCHPLVLPTIQQLLTGWFELVVYKDPGEV